MKNIKIVVSVEGYFDCSSCFYRSADMISPLRKFDFKTGINTIYGEIDSGAWAISYLISMYRYKPKTCIFYDKPQISTDGCEVSLRDVSEHSCYMDREYPLFSTRKTVRACVASGLKKTGMRETPDDVQRLFLISPDRFNRPLSGTGNEVYKAMAAIGYAHGKQIFCFPWLSQKRFSALHRNMTDLLDILEKLEKTVILPLGVSCQQCREEHREQK